MYYNIMTRKERMKNMKKLLFLATALVMLLTIPGVSIHAEDHYKPYYGSGEDPRIPCNNTHYYFEETNLIQAWTYDTHQTMNGTCVITYYIYMHLKKCSSCYQNLATVTWRCSLNHSKCAIYEKNCQSFY